jgi:hypothetical protein
MPKDEKWQKLAERASCFFFRQAAKNKIKCAHFFVPLIFPRRQENPEPEGK